MQKTFLELDGHFSKLGRVSETRFISISNPNEKVGYLNVETSPESCYSLLAQYHPWTSLERPNSNSGLPGTVRTQSEIDPNSVFLSIVLGSHDSPGTVVS